MIECSEFLNSILYEILNYFLVNIFDKCHYVNTVFKKLRKLMKGFL